MKDHGVVRFPAHAIIGAIDDPMATDEDLLTAWRGGDRRAGNDLFQRHFEPVRRFFINKTEDDPSELVQRTFLRCVDAQSRFEARASFRTFLFAIAHNVLREHYRARARGLRAEDDLDDCSIVDLGASPSTALHAEREQRALLLALRQIPLRFQVILELYFWENVSGREIGEILGVPEDTARSRIRRGKELLREALQKTASSPEIAQSTDDDLDRWAAGIRAGMG